MRVQVEQIKDGDINSTDVFNQYGALIISAGTVLQEKHIDMLKRHHIDMLNIEEQDESPFDIEIISPYDHATPTPERVPIRSIQLEEGSQFHTLQIRTQLYPVYEQALHTTHQIFEHALHTGEISYELVESTISPLLNHFHKERDVVSLLLQLRNDDEYTSQHSIQVSMLSYYLAKWLGYSEEDALRIGKAGYLHDIGKCKIDHAILYKPSALTAEEYTIVKEHTVFGGEIIQANYSDEWLVLGALQHHERMDGSGYPYGISGEDIHPVAKIIAVTDVYSAMISSRVYQEKRDLFSVLHEMYKLSFNHLDPQVAHTFIRQMLPNFLHKRVKLSDGRTGTIIMNHSTEFFKPLVKIDEDFIDLSVFRQVEIERVYM